MTITASRMLRTSIVSLGLVALAACGIVPKKEDITIYTPLGTPQPDASWPMVRGRLIIARPTSNALLDTARVLVRPKPNELQVYKSALWSDPVPELVQNAILRTLEDSGKIESVGRRGGGISGDYELRLDVRRFDSDYDTAATPTVKVEIAAKIISDKDDAVMAYRLFQAQAPVASEDMQQVAEGFEKALGQVSREISGWSLEQLSYRR